MQLNLHRHVALLIYSAGDLFSVYDVHKNIACLCVPPSPPLPPRIASSAVFAHKAVGGARAPSKCHRSSRHQRALRALSYLGVAAPASQLSGPTFAKSKCIKGDKMRAKERESVCAEHALNIKEFLLIIGLSLSQAL